MTKVINLFGQPCSGKSTLAAGLFYDMKMRGLNVELVTEWCKEKVYEKAPYPFKDQLYTFAKQHKKVRQLIDVVDYIVSDSPIVQGLVYASNEPELFPKMVLQYFNQYDNLNILLKPSHAYHNEGRLQTEAEASQIGCDIENMLKTYEIPYIVLPTKQALENILEILKEVGIL